MTGVPASAAALCCCYAVLWAGALWQDTAMVAASTFHMDIVYKYSEQFRSLMQARNMEHLISHWPRVGTLEHYMKLVQLDRHRHDSRNLINTTASDVYSLSPTNETFDTWGGLQYSFITIGTPSQTFLVALDTGSDLLWVPCDCQQCAPTNWTTYGLPGLNFSVYSPASSKTSKSVPCSDSICSSTLSPSTCTGNSETCTYDIKYLSPNLSTSGTIVQDVVYLNSESADGGNITTPIYFGCGKVQTGDFLNGFAPNGLFGLGPDVYSVPTTLAKNSIVPNVFSMCFSSADGSGRLVFGKKGNSSLQQTPLVSTNPSVVYAVEATNFVVGNVSIQVSGVFIFDTGTSITTLPPAIVKAVGDALDSQITSQVFQFIYQETTVFNYCWNTSYSSTKLPTLISMVFSGGSTWDINPYLQFTDSAGNVLPFICLGIIEASNVSIIGFNFMGGYEYFFDQESMILSWALSDCYTLNTSASQGPQGSPSGMPSPSPSPESKATLSPESSPNSPSSLSPNSPPSPQGPQGSLSGMPSPSPSPESTPTLSPESSPNSPSSLSPNSPPSPSLSPPPPSTNSPLAQPNKALKSVESLSFHLLLIFVCTTLALIAK